MIAPSRIIIPALLLTGHTMAAGWWMIISDNQTPDAISAHLHIELHYSCLRPTCLPCLPCCLQTLLAPPGVGQRASKVLRLCGSKVKHGLRVASPNASSPITSRGSPGVLLCFFRDSSSSFCTHTYSYSPPLASSLRSIGSKTANKTFCAPFANRSGEARRGKW